MSNEGSSSDAAKLTSPRASPAKSRARHEEEEKKEEEEASNRVSPPPRDVEMQDPPRDEGAVDVEVRSLEVPPIEVVRTTEVQAIKAERTRVWQNHLNYPGSSALAITIKATSTQTHFKRNNSWSVG